MRRYSVLLIGIMAFTAGCEDDPAPNPGTLPPVFTATLTTAAELPAPTTELTCSGTVRVQLNVTRANATSPITAATADFNATIAACPTTTVINIAHIHEAPAGVHGRHRREYRARAGEVMLANGAGDFTKNGINVDLGAGAAADRQRRRVSTSTSTRGEPPGIIRGQLTKSSSDSQLTTDKESVMAQARSTCQL